MITLEEYWEGKEVEVVQNKKGQKVHAFRPGTSETFCIGQRQKDFSKPFYNDFVDPLSNIVTCEDCKGLIEGMHHSINDEEWDRDYKRRSFNFDVLIDKDVIDFFEEKFSYIAEFGGVKRRLFDRSEIEKMINDHLRNLKEGDK